MSLNLVTELKRFGTYVFVVITDDPDDDPELVLSMKKKDTLDGIVKVLKKQSDRKQICILGDLVPGEKLRPLVGLKNLKSLYIAPSHLEDIERLSEKVCGQ